MQNSIYGLLTGGLFLVWASMTQADDTANAIIEKAVKAHGGAEKLAKLKVRQEKANFTLESGGKTFPFTSDSQIQLPDRAKTTTRRKIAMFIDVINGDKAWSNIGGKTREATAEQLIMLKERLHADYVVTLAPMLKDKRFALSPLGEIKVKDRPALGVKVSAKDYRDVDLYFDKETGLLVQSGFREKNQITMQEADLAIIYSNYKEIDGLKWPMRAVTYRDREQIKEVEITELEFLDKMDASEFAKP